LAGLEIVVPQQIIYDVLGVIGDGPVFMARPTVAYEQASRIIGDNLELSMVHGDAPYGEVRE
jgi:RecA/RadA recombinase